MPTFGTDSPNTPCTVRCACGGRGIIVQHALRGDHRSTARRFPNSCSELGSRRLVPHVLRHPDFSVDRHRPVVFPLVIHSVRTVVSAIGPDELSAVHPIDHIAADTHLDLRSAAPGDDDRQVVTPASFEQGVGNGFAAHRTVLQLHLDIQRRLLRHEHGPVTGIGLRLESLDLHRRRTRFRLRRRHGEVHDGLDDRTADLHCGDRRGTVVLHDHGELRHEVIENHRDGCAARPDLPCDSSQQIRRRAALPLVGLHTECGGNPRLGIGIVGRQRRGLLRAFVPFQPGGREHAPVVGHQTVRDIIARSTRDGQPDPVVLVEIQSRHAGNRRRNPDGGRCLPVVGAACSQRHSGQQHE